MIVDLKTAEAFLRQLIEEGRSFHLEDDPFEVIDGNTGKFLFAHWEVYSMQKRRIELYALPRETWGEHGCPIGFMLHLEKEMGK
jgi:hypothetical protein